MSTDISCGFAVGFAFFSQSDFTRLGKPVEEEFHMEDRFDPKTGEKIKPVRVVDKPAGYEITVGKDTFRLLDPESEDEGEADDLEDLVSAIADRVKCQSSVSITSDGSCKMVMFSVKLDRADDGVDDYNLTTDGSVSFRQLAGKAKKLDELRNKLIEIGLKPKEARIHTTYNVLS